MFLITAQFRPARSKRNSAKEGVVFYRIAGRAEGEGERLERNVNSNIHAADASALQTERAAIVSQLRLLYCVIERREDSNDSFTTDDVADDFRKALSGDESMNEAIAKSRSDFPLRSDLVSVGREFKSDFKFVDAEKADANDGNVCGFITTLTQSLEKEKRVSQAKNFHSLLANLKLFTDGKDISFKEIDQNFIHRYADWLKHIDITDSTQSFYLRNFRAVLNKAHASGLIGSTSGWFQEVNTKIEHPVKSPKKELSPDLMLKIEKLDLPENSHAALVRDMFMFGFYCGGMELIDIANLTSFNIQNGVLVYRRRLKGHERKVFLGQQAMKIIERYKSKSEKYLFPLLTDKTLFTSIRNYACQKLKRIGKAVGYPKLSFNMNITAYNSMLSEVNLSELLLRRS